MFFSIKKTVSNWIKSLLPTGGKFNKKNGKQLIILFDNLIL